ncbi:MAG: outer membrane protein assembly factor BamB [Zoogloeaceae bacterium]|jgi:outer membrane protein assembly factor BamB|nr:outer membrane protein assembly factor BamB [Zoogloeaceae bacterium]
MQASAFTRRCACALLGAFAAAALLSGCSGLSNPFASNRPKPAVLPTITVTADVRADWSYSIGKAGEAVFYPAIAGEAIFVAAADGSIARLENGVQQWRIKAGKPLSAGVGSDGVRVVVGTRQGDVLAFSARDGSPLWQAKVSSEIFAPPLVEDDLIIVRSGDNHIEALDAEGQRKWFYQRPSPSLSLRSTAPLVLADQFILSGFPGGKLVALSSQNGAPIWEGTVALPKGATELERVTDVVSSPATSGPTGCAIAYQGRVTCFDFAQSGNALWSRDISSSAGLSVDTRSVYVTDDNSAVHALDLTSGSSRWKMESLPRRQLTLPQVTSTEYLAAGDVEGYVHLIDKNTGALAGRFKTDGSPIRATPQRLPGGKILVQTQAGRVYVLDVR